jgi:hypothetical protein
MGRPHDLPMRRGRAVFDDFIRWGSTSVQNFEPTSLVTQAAPSNQLIKARLDYPQTWTLFLFANLLTGVPGSGSSSLDWAITIGTGNAQNTFHFTFVWDAAIVPTVQDFDSISTAKQRIFKELVFPAKDIQVVGQWTVVPAGGSPPPQTLELGCYVGPRVLHGYGEHEQ